ncbi:hypothetical protein V6N11_065136 [Hibiscus sabdariffa]|uniref:Uncharacterized protein n=1 Tax=Hibiscus sabdariffa TaxID=183260 RepID=A0ABR2SIZ1_9ROSI
MLKMLIRIHKLQVKTIRSTRNVENVGKGFTSFKSKLVAPPGSFENIGEDSRTPKLFAPPGNVDNVGKNSRAASRNSLLHQEMLIRIHKPEAETIRSTWKC